MFSHAVPQLFLTLVLRIHSESQVPVQTGFQLYVTLSCPAGAEFCWEGVESQEGGALNFPVPPGCVPWVSVSAHLPTLSPGPSWEFTFFG